MFKILKQFAYGNIPKDGSFNRNSKYGRAVASAAALETKLLARLRGEDKALFEKFIEANGKVIFLTATRKFVGGYTLGLTMTAEAFVNLDKF